MVGVRRMWCQGVMVDFHKILNRERRLAAISKATDELANIKKYPPNALLNAVGQLDWLDELHRLLYDEHAHEGLYRKPC